MTPWTGNPNRPFCSERCRMKDLGNWASERYRVPGQPADAAMPEPIDDDDETN